MIELRSRLAELAGRNGLKIASVGTHPFSHWRDQHITQGERYKQIVEDMQLLARANLIFGLHVHVGMPDREIAIHVMNQARYFFPTFTLSRSIHRSGSVKIRGSKVID